MGGVPRWGNQEWEYYTDRAQNVATDRLGNLAITARKESLPGTLPGGARIADASHVFAIEWSPDQVIWRLDGQLYFSYAKGQLAAGTAWVFDHPFFILLNLAVGGGWPGPPTASTIFPATMLVDYVRVYAGA